VDTLANAVFLAAFLLALVLSLVPLFPSALVLGLGALLREALVGFSGLAPLEWGVFLGLLALAMVGDNLAAAWGARRWGAGRAGILGAVIGAVLGTLVLGPPGMLLGPFLGALAFELLGGRPGGEALRAGVGGALGFFWGVLARLLLNAAAGAYFYSRIS